MSSLVDWDWANQQYSLAIFEAAGLSLGFELNTLAPVRQQFKDRPYIEPPKEYGERVFMAYEYVKAGKLKCFGRTAQKHRAFDQNAKFDEGQFWEIDPADFRRWCDSQDLPVPDEWRPASRAYPIEMDKVLHKKLEKPTKSLIFCEHLHSVGIISTEQDYIMGWPESLDLERLVALQCPNGTSFQESLLHDLKELCRLKIIPSSAAMRSAELYIGGLHSPPERQLETTGIQIKAKDFANFLKDTEAKPSTHIKEWIVAQRKKKKTR